jgi:hypothetical protein
MMRRLALKEGSSLNIRVTSLDQGTFVTLRPQEKYDVDHFQLEKMVKSVCINSPDSFNHSVGNLHMNLHSIDYRPFTVSLASLKELLFRLNRKFLALYTTFWSWRSQQWAIASQKVKMFLGSSQLWANSLNSSFRDIAYQGATRDSAGAIKGCR